MKKLFTASLILFFVSVAMVSAQDQKKQVKIIKIVNGDTTIIEKEGKDAEMLMRHHPIPPSASHHEGKDLHHPGSVEFEKMGEHCFKMMKRHCQTSCEPGDSCARSCEVMIECLGKEGNPDCCKMGKTHRDFNKPGEFENVRIIKTPDGKTKKVTTKTIVTVEEIEGETMEERILPAPDDLKVFPNPSAGKFTIETAGDGKNPLVISVSDPAGKEVFREQIKENGTIRREIDLSGKPRGAYIVRISQEGKEVVKKLVVE